MKTEISLAQWSRNLQAHNRFYNFWSNVSRITFKPLPESGHKWQTEIGEAIIDGVGRVQNITTIEGAV